MLQDLNKLVQDFILKIDKFDAIDCELPDRFINEVDKINNDTIEYGKFSSCVTNKQNQRVFISNSWFYIAAILAPLYQPFQEYKEALLKLVSKDVLKLKQSNLSEYKDKVTDLINKSSASPQDKEYLIKFATNYSWWNRGNDGKTLDRNDVFDSTILSIANLVNAAQGYVANIWNFFGQNPQYISYFNYSIANYLNAQSYSINKNNLSLQQIFYGAPGTGKSHKVKEVTDTLPKSDVFRTTFHPDSDYSTFVGCYKPTKLVDKIYTVSELHDLFVKESTTFPNRPEHRFAAKYSKSFAKLTNKEAEQVFEGVSTASTITAETPKLMASVEEYNKNGCNNAITYDFTPQSFTKAYIAAWKNYSTPITKTKTVVASPTMPASSATSPYTSASAGTPANIFDRIPLDGLDLTTDEEDLLKVVDAFLFPFVGVDCFGDIHNDLDAVYIKDSNEETITVTLTKKNLEAKKKEYEAKCKELVKEKTNESFMLLARLHNMIGVIEGFLKDMDDKGVDSLEITRDRSLWGLHSYNPESVTIYKGEINKLRMKDDIEAAVVSTYIHEMFHAYFKKCLGIPEIEEPIVECATLCFLEVLSGKINSFKTIFEFYKEQVTSKKFDIGYSYYGFGSYLFEHRSLDWIKLFNDAVINANSNRVKQYKAMFADFYPTDEEKAMSLLYAILTTATDTVEETIDASKPVFLVIEEINRGNCAQIFGDLFQLLDRNKAGFSTYPIKPDTDLGNYIKEEFEKEGLTSAEYPTVFSGEELILPNNLHIWATMNTSDQSLFPIDSAFKRRWDWEYVPIKRADKKPEKEWIIKVAHDGKTYWCYWWEFLEAINHQIEETTHSEDKQLGYFFAKPKAGEDFISADTFVNKVIFYLWNDVFKDEDSAVFQYDNDKVEDVSINRSGTMYFRHFMENKDEMIHYFINQLFAMGKDSTPVVPIDYLKNDANSNVIEHLPKMRELKVESTSAEEIPEEIVDDADSK